MDVPQGYVWKDTDTYFFLLPIFAGYWVTPIKNSSVNSKSLEHTYYNNEFKDLTLTHKTSMYLNHRIWRWDQFLAKQRDK